MPRLAVVISAVGTIESLEGTMVSVLENRPADCEILVALNQPYQDPYALQGEVRFIKHDVAATPVERIQRALAGTRAPFVHLLSSGCEVTEGWCDAALARFGDRQVASVAPLVTHQNDSRTVFAAGIGYRASGQRTLIGHGQPLSAGASSLMIGPAGFAAFYRKAAIDFVGGLSTQLGMQHADVDLALTLRHAGFISVLEAGSRVVARPEAEPLDSPRLRALYDERLFWRQLPAESGWRAIAAHAWAVALEAVLSLGRPRMFTRLAARGWACCELRGHARHRRALVELSRRAVRSKPARENLRVDSAHHVLSPSDATTVGVPTR